MTPPNCFFCDVPMREKTQWLFASYVTWKQHVGWECPRCWRGVQK